MCGVIWTASAIGDLKQMAKRRAERLRREADLALGRFGRALVPNISRVPPFEGVYVLERGGLRVFFRDDAEAETVSILKAVDVRTARRPGDGAQKSAAERRGAPGREITDALGECPVGSTEDEMVRSWLEEAQEQMLLARLAAVELGEYLQEKDVGRVTTDTALMADTDLALLLGLAEVAAAGMSIGVCPVVGKVADQVRIPRAGFEVGFVSDYYVIAQVAADLGSVQFLGFITDEELEASSEQRAQSREQRAESEEPAIMSNWRRATLEVELDQLSDMAELENELRAKSEEQRAKSEEQRVIDLSGGEAGTTLVIPKASDLEGSLTSQQLGETLFGEMAHESARDSHLSWLEGWLEADEEHRYLGHVFGCAECRTELLNFMSLCEGIEEVHVALSHAASTELAVVERHPLARREAPESTELGRLVEAGELAVLPVGTLARIRFALGLTVSATWAWAREHPVPAAATSVAFAAAVLFILTMVFKTTDVKQEQLRRARTPHIVQVSRESKLGAPTELIPAVLTISNAQGQVLYTESFPSGTKILVHEKPVDLNGDGYMEVVFTLHAGDPAGWGRIYVYSFDEAFLSGQRDRPLMMPPYNTYHQLEYSYFPTPWSGRAVVEKLIVDDLLQNGQQKIVLIWRDAIYAGSALTVLSLPGQVEAGLVPEAEYIHPGNIQHLQIVSIGEQKKLLIAGMNNALRGTQLPFGQSDQYYPFIAVLDPHQIWGEAPPYLQNEQGKGRRSGMAISRRRSSGFHHQEEQ